MRLIRLALRNFRQHADSELEFRPGLTGIIGPNGAGKTTILEAIAWAIYGAPAVRGTKDTLRFNRAEGRVQVRVELDFELRGERFRVLRTPNRAELYRADGADPIASGISEVTRQLTRRLGMTLREFFNTYFTGQKELQFLAAMGATERGRFLSQVLGYERLRVAQNMIREERKVLKGQVDELQRALGDATEIKRELAEAEERLKAASIALNSAEGKCTDTAAAFAELEPVWREAQATRERDSQLKQDLRVAAARLERVLQDKAEAAAELDKLAGAEKQLEQLETQVKPLEESRLEDERLKGLAEAHLRRQALEKQLAEQRERVEALVKRVSDQEERGRSGADLAEKRAAQDTVCRELDERLQDAIGAWQRDKQDVDARLRILRKSAEELIDQIKRLESAGPDGTCPTCKRPLGSEYDSVLDLVRGQYETTVQDGKWHKKRLEQLGAEPDEVKKAREELAAARKLAESIGKELAAAESALSQAKALKGEQEKEEARARQLAGEIAELAVGYDAERHAQVKEAVKRLGELETQITQVRTRLERQAPTRKALAEAEEEERQIRSKMSDFEKERTALAFSEDRYTKLSEEYESSRAVLSEARLALERAKGEAETARQAADAARRAEREFEEVRLKVAQREREFRLHNELDQAFGELRDELNDRVRPELSEIASVFLTELTDGRYNRIEISDNYDVVVLDDGEEKPVISGGEEDLANLVLRLAISQMIADRAGQTLSLLIFDEVFGGLDEHRREGVVRLLQRLQNNFEQVVLITHIESIREGMDQVIRVVFDEPSGASRVRDESPGASYDDLMIETIASVVGG